MEPSSVETDKIGLEFDADACEFCERYKNRGLSRSSKLLLRFILDNNVRERSVLDLGCGAGGLSFELLKEVAAFCSTSIRWGLLTRLCESRDSTVAKSRVQGSGWFFFTHGSDD